MSGNENDIKNNQSEEKPKAPSWLIDNITEASKNARQIYFLFIGFLSYCALTIVSTSDRQIILNEEASLPIIKLDVSLNGFFILSPVISLLVFTYLQLYLQRLKGLITDLRTNYASVNKRRLYPWMINIAEAPESGIVGKLQRVFVSFTLWWSLPLVLVLDSYWYVKKHDPVLSYVIGVMPILAISIVYYFWSPYECVHNKHEDNKSNFLRYISKNISKIALTFLVMLYSVILLCNVVPKANKGKGINVDLSNQKLIEKLIDDYEGLHWVDLSKAHLEGANLNASVLKRADLRFAKLQRADLKKAILEGARLEAANLRDANLDEANLVGASLVGACLEGASLKFSLLNGSNFLHAELKGADLEDANLNGARLEKTKDLTIDQLYNVATLYKAALDPELMEQVKEKYPHLLYNPDELSDQVLIEKKKDLEEKKLQYEIKEEGYIKLPIKPQVDNKKPDTIHEDLAKKTEEFQIASNEYITVKKARLLYIYQDERPQNYTNNQFEEMGAKDNTVIIDHATKLMWDKSGSDKMMNYENAKIFLKKLNREQYAGKSDWRLPSLKEAITLIKQEKNSDGLFIDSIFDKKLRFIWTSDKVNALNVWIVNFAYGGCSYNRKIGYGLYFVLAVRSTQ